MKMDILKFHYEIYRTANSDEILKTISFMNENCMKCFILKNIKFKKVKLYMDMKIFLMKYLPKK